MLSIYFYPKSDPQLDKSSNPYVFNFERSLLKSHRIVNKYINKKGVLDLFKYLLTSDIFLFNWIENLATKKLGKLQVAGFLVFLFGAKILRKKIVWILHNTYSHDIKKNSWTNFMFSLMMKHASLILTHSLSGIDFAKINYPKFSSKIIYLIHPVQEVIPVISESQQKFDILIWGVILPYKGIVQFLEFIKGSKDWSSIKILIAGKCFDDEYKMLLNKYLSENIIFFDEFYDIKEISRLANQSKFILFTYRSDSVLSSGSLMDSIRMGSNIIGPNFGAFKDLSSYSFMHTYNDINEIIKILKTKKNDLKSNSREIQNFCIENSWDYFIEKLDKELIRILG
jgi:beta-1,4-mannosyltransferase